jgi:hypothetical protein
MDSINKLLKMEKEVSLPVPVKKPKLNPIDPHIRLIDKMQKLTMNSSARSFGKDSLTEGFSQKPDNKQLDLSKSMINFDEDNELYETRRENNENVFNNLVKNNIILEFHEVNGFLLSIGLDKYFDAFLQNGLNSLDKILS